MRFTSCSVLSVLSYPIIYKVGFFQAPYSLSLFIQSDLLYSTGVHMPFACNVITQVFGLKPLLLSQDFFHCCLPCSLSSFFLLPCLLFKLFVLNWFYLFDSPPYLLFSLIPLGLQYTFWINQSLPFIARTLHQYILISFPTLFELLHHTLYFYMHHKHMSYCYLFWLEWVIF